MVVERALALLALLYAVYGLIKLYRAYKRSKEWEFVLLLSIVFLVGLDAALFLYGGSLWELFMRFHYVVVLVPLLTYLLGTYLVSLRSKEVSQDVMLQNAFQQYLSPAVLSDLLRNPSKLKLGGEKRLVTALYADIKGFKSLADKMAPESLVNFLNVFLSELSDVVLQLRGVLDKYFGSALLAFWGAPVSEDDHALLSCEAALAIMKRLKELQPVWDKKGFPRVSLQLGLNTGRVVVGNLGSSKRFDYSLWGFQARLAKVLCRLNKTYATNILISESVFEHVRDAFVCREVDIISVAGKKPVRVHELLGAKEQASKYSEFLGVYQQALVAYRRREWLKARGLFDEASKLRKADGVCRVYVDRIKDFIRSPPPKEWEGVVRV